MEEPIKPLNLYQLTTELEDLEQDLLESGGVLTDEIEERYEDLLEMESDKIEGYVAMIRKFEASEEAIRSERERLQKAEQSMRKAADSLKSRLAWAMQRRGEDAYTTPLGKVRLQRAGRRPVVVDVDEDALPEAFKRVRVQADKQALQRALESDDDSVRRSAEAYAHLDEPSYYLRIY